MGVATAISEMAEAAHTIFTRRQSVAAEPVSEDQRLWEAEIRLQERSVYINALHPWLLSVTAIVVIIIMSVYRTQHPDADIGGASVSAWCIFILAILVGWPFCLVLMMGMHSAYSHFGVSYPGHDKIIYTLKSQTVSIAFACWGIILIVSYRVVFHQINPLPAYNTTTGTEQAISHHTDEWVSRFIILILVFALLSAVKDMIVSNLAFNSRSDKYYDRVRATIRVGVSWVVKRMTMDDSMTSGIRSRARE